MNLKEHTQIIDTYREEIKKLNGIIDMKSEQVMGMNKRIQWLNDEYQELCTKYQELKKKPIRYYFKLLFLPVILKVLHYGLILLICLSPMLIVLCRTGA